jgi:hypothetical protein
MSKENELSRIKFLESRDGIEGAKSFALRTYAAYRTALFAHKKGRKKHFASTPEYRLSFIESCLVFRAYLRQ